MIVTLKMRLAIVLTLFGFLGMTSVALAYSWTEQSIPTAELKLPMFSLLGLFLIGLALVSLAMPKLS